MNIQRYSKLLYRQRRLASKMGSPQDLKGDKEDAVDENTPLIIASGAGSTSQSNEEGLSSQQSTEDGDEDALPKSQIALLCFARLVEPIAFFSIFPFINQMIFEIGGIEEARVGFYSGLIVSHLMCYMDLI
jgi:hypothetical protein